MNPIGNLYVEYGVASMMIRTSGRDIVFLAPGTVRRIPPLLVRGVQAYWDEPILRTPLL